MQDDLGEWLSVSAAARRLGITRQSLQNRIKRGSVEHRRNNRGDPLVRIVGDFPQPVSDAVARSFAAPAAPLAASGPVSLDDVCRLLGEQSERMERQHSAAMAMMVERVDAAELRAERVEEHLTRVLDALLIERRSWWSRWFGKSKHSNLSG